MRRSLLHPRTAVATLQTWLSARANSRRGAARTRRARGIEPLETRALLTIAGAGEDPTAVYTCQTNEEWSATLTTAAADLLQNVDAKGAVAVLAEPTISIAPPASITEGDVNSVVDFVVTLSAAAEDVVSVQYSTVAGTAMVETDFLGTTGTLTFNPGETSKTIPITIVGDNIDEGNESFEVALTAPTGATIETARATGEIVDDDSPPTLSVSSPSLPEPSSGTAPMSFVISLSKASGRQIVVNYGTGELSAIEGNDYVATNGSVTFEPGETQKTVDVLINADAESEEPETFALLAAATGEAPISSAIGTGTILPPVSADQIRIRLETTDLAGNPITQITAGGDFKLNAYVFDLRASNNDGVYAAFVDVTFDGALAATNGAMDHGANYTVGASGTSSAGLLDEAGGTFNSLNFPGPAERLLFSVPFTAGATPGALTFTSDPADVLPTHNTLLANTDGAIPAGQIVYGAASIEILAVPTVSVTGASVNEGNSGTQQLAFTVALSQPSASEVTVDYSTSDLTALAGLDYAAKSGQLLFAPGETSKTVLIDILGDALNEPDESFNLDLANPINATLETATAVGAILNDDPEPTISIAPPASITEEDADAISVFTVTLSAPSGKAITVEYATQAGSATAGTDFVATTGTLTFNPGETSKAILVTIIGDTIDEGNEQFEVALSAPANATLNTAAAQATIVDNDARPTLAVSSPSVDEPTTGTATLSFVVSLSKASGESLTFNYATNDGTAVAGVDYVAAAGTLVFAPGETQKTVNVTVNANAASGAASTLALLVSSTLEPPIPSAVGTGTILAPKSTEQVRIRLATTDLAGNPISQIAAGAPFLVSAYVEDLRTGDDLEGVFQAFFDVTYATALINATGPITYGEDFPTAPSGSLDTPGLIDEIGAAGAAAPPSSPGGEKKLFSVQVVGLAAGDVTFTADPADELPAHAILLYGSDTPAPFDNVSFVAAPITIAPLANAGPVAVDDSVTTPEDTPTTINVLSNDTDSDGALDPTTVTITTAPQNGLASVNPVTGVVTYTPVSNYFGVDSFAYTVRDDDGALSNIATVTLNITAVNDPPVAVDDAENATFNTPVVIDILANDFDIDGTLVPSSVVIVTAPENGTAEINPATGAITYTPHAGYVGSDTIVYTVGDDQGATSNEATVAIFTVPTISVGNTATTEGKDAIFTITLSGASTQSVTVNYATADGVALKVDDYEETSGSVTFAPGETEKTVHVITKTDNVKEPTEEFLLVLSDPTNAVLSANSTGTGVIRDAENLVTAKVLGSVPEITLLGEEIEAADDEDYFRLTAHSTGKLVVTLLGDKDAGNLDVWLLDKNGNILGQADPNTDNPEQVVIPVVSQQTYYIQVFGATGDVVNTGKYSLEIENFPAPVPSAVVLHPDDDNGHSSSDNVTDNVSPRIVVQADLSDFENFGIDILDPAEANGAFAGAAVEIYLNGQSIGFATPRAGSNSALFDFQLTAAQLATGPKTNGGILNLVSAAVRIFDGLNVDGVVTSATGRSQLSDPLRLRWEDTTGPKVLSVGITNSDFNLFAGKAGGVLAPTPLVNSLSVVIYDLPGSALSPSGTSGSAVGAVNANMFRVAGDQNGLAAIKSVTPSAATTISIDGVEYTAVTLRIDFVAPLPDDRFTLTIFDTLTDGAGNALDGESNAAEPNGSPAFPSGNGKAGGNFVARFTVDSLPEVGIASSGSVQIDTNGNLIWDPANTDQTNRDLTYVLGNASDYVFAGNFVAAADGIADGFDKLAVYGRVNGQWRWLVDTNNDGVPDLNVADPSNINGFPFAGDFDGNPANGDEVGVFDGVNFWLDTDHDYKVDRKIASDLRGHPIAGDFDGDGIDDLGTYRNDRGEFQFNLSGASGGLDGTIDDTISFNFPGVQQRPVAADMDGDGIDDIGLRVAGNNFAGSQGVAEWYFLVSRDPLAVPGSTAPAAPKRVDGTAVTLKHAFSPTPLGGDIFARFGDELGIPVVGNFDPPVATKPPSTDTGSGQTTGLTLTKARSVVTALYQDILGRAPDSYGLNLYAHQMVQGTTSESIARTLMNSAERFGRVVDGLYQTFLERQADPAGRAHWVGALSAGATEDQVAQSFLASAEYTSRHASNAAYVEGLYQDILGRNADTAGRASWAAQLAAGKTRAEVAQSFLDSQERRNKVVDQVYRQLFHRSADSLGLQVYSTRIASDTPSVRELVASLAASDEYFARAYRGR